MASQAEVPYYRICDQIFCLDQHLLTSTARETRIWTCSARVCFLVLLPVWQAQIELEQIFHSPCKKAWIAEAADSLAICLDAPSHLTAYPFTPACITRMFRVSVLFILIVFGLRTVLGQVGFLTERRMYLELHECIRPCYM